MKQQRKSEQCPDDLQMDETGERWYFCTYDETLEIRADSYRMKYRLKVGDVCFK
jgi:hypothetical protein